MGLEGCIECRKQGEIRTGALLSQLQKKMEDLEKEREYDEIHFNPAVVPRDVSVNARYRLINEGVNMEEWVLIDVRSENGSWDKWVLSNALKSVLPEIDLPEELTHALEVCRMENSSHQEGMNEELERIREEYEGYKKRTKTATILLQDRCLEAMNEVKTLRESLDVMEKRVSTAEEVSRVSEENEKKRASETENELEEMRRILQEKENLLTEMKKELLSRRDTLEEEEKCRIRIESELEERKRREKALKEELELKNTALERLEKPVKMLEHRSVSVYSDDNKIETTVQPDGDPEVSGQLSEVQSMNTETESTVPIQIVNEIPISLQMPADVRLSTELNKDNRLSRRDESDR